MAAKGKGSVLFLLVNEESGSFYVIKVNPKKGNQKLELMKYDRKLRKHCLFKQKKLTS